MNVGCPIPFQGESTQGPNVQEVNKGNTAKSKLLRACAATSGGTASFVAVLLTTGSWFAMSTALSCRMVLFAWLARVEWELVKNY